MDKLKTTDVGGLPFVLDDLRWALGQTTGGNYGIITALTDSLRAYGENFIVQGCVEGGTTGAITLTEGWIMLGGELLKVEAQGPFDEATDNQFIKDVTFDPAGNKDFQNGGNFDTYEKNRGIISGAVGTLAYNGPRLIDTWKDIDDYQGDFGDGATAPQVKKVDNNNSIQLRGLVSKTAGVSVVISTHVLTLPAGYWPSATRYFTLPTLETANNRAIAEINTSGELRIRGDLLTVTLSSNGIVLDNITISL